MSTSELLSQGAEAHVYATTFCGRACVLKRRVRKAYRHPTLDAQLQTSRTLLEARLLTKCRRVGVAAPTVYHVDVATGSIYMERVVGLTLKQFVGSAAILTPELHAAAAALGRGVAALHNADVIHGDLTSSNVLVRPHEAGVADVPLTFIDFGLGYSSAMTEDKAVDLYVLERALVSTHAQLEPALFDAFRAAYAAASADAKAILAKYEQVKLRGRKKVCFG